MQQPIVLIKIFEAAQHDLIPVRYMVFNIVTGLILGLHPANDRRRYKVMPSLIGWAQT